VGVERAPIVCQVKSHPITSLQKKGTKFEWTTKCEESFQHLKEFLTSAPILKVAYLDEYFVVYTNACKEGMSGVLTQNGNVICYESKNLKEHEKNYATHDLELAVIVHALKMWRHYLMGIKFKLKIDHSGMKHLFEQLILNAGKTREYDFNIKHIKRKENKVANTLSRRVHEMHVATISMCRTDLKDIILEAITIDPHCALVKKRLQQNSVQQKYKITRWKKMESSCSGTNFMFLTLRN
jgi:hypothetical protein